MNRRHLIDLALPATFLLILLTGCSGLLTKQPLQISYHTLEILAAKTQTVPILNPDKTLPTLVIYPPKAAAGYDTRRMMYTRFPHQLEYFARNEWVDAPADMLQSLMLSTMAQTGQFNAVLPKISQVKSEFRLESEMVRLLQIFNEKPGVNEKPSQVQFTLRATIIESATGKVIAQREFDARIQASADNPVAGVVAANKAVNQVLTKLNAFSHEAMMAWRTSLGAN